MAPEQQRGQRCEPAADQFAFCAALHEALAGERVFAKGTWQEIWLAKVHGPPATRGMPRWLAALVRRGFDPDPTRRHPSMTAIAEALEARPRPRPRTRRAVVLSAALAATAIFAVPSAAETNASSQASIAAATTQGRETIQRDALDRIKATQRAGRVHDAELQAAALADEIDSPELQASLLHRRGNIALALGRTEDAEALLSRAVEVGTTAGNDFAAAAAANLLVYLTGVQQHRLDAALEWARHAEAALERIGGDDRERAVLLYALGTAHGTAGQHAEAIEHHEAALAIRTRIFGPRSPECAESHHGLGTALARYGRHDAALDHFRRALAIKEHLHGPESPMLAQTLDNVASQTFLLGDVEAALADNERARKLLARDLPPGAEELLANRDNRAVMLESAGRFDEAERELQAVAQERIAQLGPSHPDVAHSLGNLGRLALQRQRWSEAEDHFVGALAIVESIDARNPETAGLLTGLAAARIERGQPGSAIEPLERALSNLGKDGNPRARADAQFYLARALDALGRDRDRVHALVHEVAATYREVAPANVAEAEALLRR